MRNYIPGIIMLLIMSLISPMNSRAASPDSDRDAEQLGDIGRELSHASMSHRNPVQEKHARQSHLHERQRILAKLQQGDLLHELLAAEAVHHESIQICDEDRKLHQ